MTHTTDTPIREKLNTIQKRNNLNAVYRKGDPGPGGAYHTYQVEWPLDPETGLYHYDSICFQTGPRATSDNVPGILDTDLLEIVRDRLKCFQAGDYACRENACALTHIEEALMWMNKRVEDRAERGVLGTTEK